MNAFFILIDIVIMIIRVARPGGNGGMYANKVLLNSTLEQAALADALFMTILMVKLAMMMAILIIAMVIGNHHHRPHH